MTKLFYRIGSVAESKIFEEMNRYYYGIVINANLVSLYSKWLPVFLQKLGKPFFIDPMTYVFAFDLENIKKNDDIRKSFEKLLTFYGSKIKRVIFDEKRELLPEDFIKKDKWNENLINDFLNNVLSLQKNLIANQFQQTLSEILDIVGEKFEIKKPNLLFLVPPYFYFDSTNNPWYHISLQLAKTAMKLEKCYKIYPIICMSKEIVLNTDEINKILKDYKEFEGCIFWISNLNEIGDDKKYLKGLLDLTKMFSIHKKHILILYGEFFSLILSKKFISGYVRNICYGERKDVESFALGGPLPRRRYYLPFTHSKIAESKARLLFSSNPDLLCKCEICSKISHKNIEEFFGNMGDVDFNKHFMAIHFSEAKMDIDKLKNLLIKNKLLCEKMKLENFGISYKHIDKWISILEGEIK